jgi:hypothetical protein
MEIDDEKSNVPAVRARDESDSVEDERPTKKAKLDDEDEVSHTTENPCLFNLRRP